jgi:HD-GYP domain-containing protein (c-di-GMP phosphodiesterase class II)
VFRSNRRKAKPILILVGAVFTVLMLVLQLFPPPFIVYLEHKTYDSLLKATHSKRMSGLTAVVDVDEASLKQFGQWPWPRHRMALLLEKIKGLGASSVGLDLILAEPDRISLGLLRAEILRDRNIDIFHGTPPAEFLDNDKILAGTLSAGPYVTSYQFLFAGGESTSGSCTPHSLSVAYLHRGSAPINPTLLTASGVLCNVETLSRASRYSGFVNVAPDSDGILRRVPLIIRYRDELYPSLALAAVMLGQGTKQVVLEVLPEGVQAIRLKGKAIPIDGDGYLLIHYRGGRNTFNYYSAADVLDGRIPRDELKNKIVFVGTSAAGLKEARATPLDPLVPGLEIHATVADNLILGDPISRSQRMWYLEFILVLVLGLSSTLFLTKSPALLDIPFLAACIAVLIYGSAWLMGSKEVFASPVLPLITLGGTYSLLTSLHFLYADWEVQRRTEKLLLTQDVIIQAMASLSETRDIETGGHIQRTRHYVKALAEKLRDHPRFKRFLDDSTVDLIFRLAPLHDVGKVGVRDSILLTPGRLTKEEFEEMKQHTILGANVIFEAEKSLGDDSFLHIAREIALTHHEKWDGTGYPGGMKGEEIPVAGRLMAVADVYDALVSRRNYKEALDHKKAVEIMAAGRATHFDPEALDAFLQIQDRFREISIRFSEEERDLKVIEGCQIKCDQMAVRGDSAHRVDARSFMKKARRVSRS